MQLDKWELFIKFGVFRTTERILNFVASSWSKIYFE